MSKFPALTTFHDVHLFYDGNITWNNEVAAKLAKACPTLQRAEAWDVPTARYAGTWDFGSKATRYIALHPEARDGSTWEVKPQNNLGWLMYATPAAVIED